MAQAIALGLSLIQHHTHPEDFETVFLGVLEELNDLDDALVAEIEGVRGVDTCGERGEYHSFAFGGPLFAAPLTLRELGRFEMEGHGLLDFELCSPAGATEPSTAERR